jgi:hypothetical protein
MATSFCPWFTIRPSRLALPWVLFTAALFVALISEASAPNAKSAAMTDWVMVKKSCRYNKATKLFWNAKVRQHDFGNTVPLMAHLDESDPTTTIQLQVYKRKVCRQNVRNFDSTVWEFRESL